MAISLVWVGYEVGVKQSKTLGLRDLARVYYDYGIDFCEQGDYGRAISDLNRAIELNYEPPSSPYFNRGLAYKN